MAFKLAYVMGQFEGPHVVKVLNVITK